MSYENWIGKSVSKKNKPFKSGKKINTVKGLITHPVLNIPAFSFYEDNSIVECRRCILIGDNNVQNR